MKTIVAGVIGGVLVAVLVLSVIIGMPTQIESAQDYVKKSSPTYIHPCQQVMLDLINALDSEKSNPRFYDESKGRFTTEGTLMINEKYSWISEKYLDCWMTTDEWITPEFKEKIEPMLESMLKPTTEPMIKSVPVKVISISEELNSKCGPGIIFDVDVNSCVLEK